MSVRFLHFLLLLFLISTAHGQFFTTDNNQSLIDQILHVVWEPSSLIRMWVGLDQLFNIVRSWRGVAKKLAALPFGGDGESHVRIQEPRSMMHHKPSVGSQIDRFNQYTSLSPVVGGGKQHRSEPYGGQHPHASSLNPAETDSSSDVRLPPPFLFQPQEEFMNDAWAEFFKNSQGLDFSSLLSKDNGDLKTSSSFGGVNAVKPPAQNMNAFGMPAQFQNLKMPGQSAPNVNGFGLPAQFQAMQNLAQSTQNVNGFGLPGQFQNMQGLAQAAQSVNGFAMPAQFQYMKNLAQATQNAKGTGLPAQLLAMNGLRYSLIQHLNRLRDALPQQKLNGHAQGFPNSNRHSRPLPVPSSLDLKNPFGNRIPPDKALFSKLLDIQRQENRNSFLKQRLVKQTGSASPPKPSDDPLMSISSQKLNMFLMLMKTLGSIHTKQANTLQNLNLGFGKYAGTMNRNDAEPLHLDNFVDRDAFETSDK